MTVKEHFPRHGIIRKAVSALMAAALLLTIATFSVPARAGSACGWTDISASLPATAQGNTALFDMHFISDDEGWIVQGGTSYIYHTADGGATWETLNTPADATNGINAIHMLNASEGYIAAQNGKICRTADGGDSWTALGSMGGTPLDIDFATGSETGYACGYNGRICCVTSSGIQSMMTGVSSNQASLSMTPEGEGWACGAGVILHYVSGSWNGDQSYPSAYYNAVHSISNTKSWAIGDGGVIIHCSDGINWVAQTNPDTSNRTLNDIFFLYENEGWAVGDSGIVLHTADGGTTWSIEAGGMTANMMTAVKFTSATNGYALGNKGTLLKYGLLGGGATVPTVTTSTPATGITDSGATVAGNVTSDGGSAVTERGFVYSPDADPAIGGAGVTNVTVGSGMGAFNTALTGLTANTLYHVRAYATNGQGTAYGADVTFTTSAAAACGWTDISATLPTTAQGNTAMLDMHFISDDEGWIVQGGTSYIYHTDDGGVTWETLSTPADATNGINAIHMLSATEGYIAAQNGKIYRTTDGGDNWTALGSMGGTPLDIDFAAGSDTGYVCGYGGKIFNVISTGIASMATGLSVNLSSISMTSEGQGWACGEDAIVHYVGGAWTLDQNAPYATYNAVHMVSGTQGWIAGDTGAIIHTTDGTNWASQTNPDMPTPKRTLLDIFFLNGNEGWAVGYNGVVLHTADGGTTWSIEAGGMTANMMTSVQFTSSANGYALGNKGTLLKYGPTGGGATVPTVTTTSPATGITATGATVAGNVTSDGGSAVTERGFVYGPDADPAVGGAGVTNVNAGSGTGAFSTTLNGLNANTLYHVRAYATNGQGTAYGADVTFTTSAAAACGWTDISLNLPATAKGSTTLPDMHFISDDEGWIVQGGTSYIYHTDDGGTTWETLSTPADATNGINAIHMLSATEGYIAAQNGKIYKTTDGGDSWTAIGSMGGPPRDMSFAEGSDTGYVCGDTGKVYSVTASGILSGATGISSNMKSISMLSDTEGWVCGEDVIMHLVDGAWEFDQSYPTESYSAVHMVSNTKGWAAGDSGVIISTADGINWNYQTNPDTSNRTLLDIFFLNQNEGWSAGVLGIMLHTANGGTTWSVEADGMTANMLRAVQFTGAANGYALGNNGTLLKYGPVVTPPACGWTDISLNLPATAQGNTAMSDMHFISDDEGWIVQGGTSYIYHTNDGGDSWETLGTPTDATNGINAIYMLSTTEGYIAAQNGKIYRTTDSGDNWAAIGSMGGTPLDIDFAASSDTGYVCGYGGRIYRVTSGGIQGMTTGVVANFASISMTPDGEGWACGENVILHYEGGTWNGDQSYPEGWHNCIHMLNSSKGWSGEDNGVIINTTDGANWNAQTNPDPSHRTLNDIYFLNQDEGWAVGNGGAVLHTANGGTTWNIEADGMTANMMTSVQFTSSANGYALGNKGTFLKYGPLGGGAAVPTVTTSTPATGVTTTGADVAGNVTSDGGSAVTERGFVYGPDADPAIGGAGVTNVTAGSGTGVFNTALTGLTANTLYHVRAYATNGQGTSYGADVAFTTTAAPSCGWTDISANLPTTAKGSTTLLDMHFISADEGWIVQSGTSYIYHTDDGGATWETLITPDDAATGIKAIYMLSATEGYIAAQNFKIYRTTDGGQNWNDLGSLGKTPADIDFPQGSSMGYVCGFNGKVYQVTSSGIESMATGLSATNFSSISMSSVSEGWACGEQVIIHYAHSEWKPDQSYPDAAYNAIHMVSNTIGWAAGDSGVIIHTIDGINWDYQTNPDTSNRTLFDIFFLNQNEGWAVGFNGVILNTADGGTTWSVEADGITTNILTAVQFTNSTNGFALGNNGTLLKYGPLGGGATAPTIATNTVGSGGVTQTTAYVSGTVSTYGTVTETEYGFVYGKAENPAIGGVGVTRLMFGSGVTLTDVAFGLTLTGLTANTAYHVRAYAINDGATLYGEDRAFTTKAEPTGGLPETGVLGTSDYTAVLEKNHVQVTTLPIDADSVSGTGVVVLDSALAAELFAAPADIGIIVPQITGITSIRLDLPAPQLKNTPAASCLMLDTTYGSVTLPGAMLKTLAGDAQKTIEITVGEGDSKDLSEAEKTAAGDRPLIALSLALDGKQSGWSDRSMPVTVTIPYTPTEAESTQSECLIIWRADGDGDPVCIPNGRYDAALGGMIFKTAQFSMYACGFNKVTFNDVSEDIWYGVPVDFIAARLITTGTGGGKFSPDRNLTRAEYLVMLMRALELAPDNSPKDNFADAGSAYYTGYLAAAKRLGIAEGIRENRYAPDRAVTRQEMLTMMYNALNVINQLPDGVQGSPRPTLKGFTDADTVAPWALDAVKRLVETGIVSGFGGRLAPEDRATRAEMAQILCNLLTR
jgi:photosystem II stability/assembly factor-like uncharacterized protein